MIKRNLKLFFRDRTGVFFSFLAVIILFALYLLFLGDTVSQGFAFPDAQLAATCWIMSGIVAIATVSTTMGAFGIMVDDRSKNIDKDFFASPIARWKITADYLLSAISVGLMMTLLTFVFAELYILSKGGALLELVPMVQMLGAILLSVVASCSMIFFLVSFFRTQQAFSVASTVLGTMIGFVTGMYVPIGVLPEAMGWVIKLFPLSHSVALMRQLLLQAPLAAAFANAPTHAVEEFQKTMGVYYWFGEAKMSAGGSIAILVLTTLVFFGLSVLNMSRKRK